MPFRSGKEARIRTDPALPRGADVTPRASLGLLDSRTMEVSLGSHHRPH